MWIRGRLTHRIAGYGVAIASVALALVISLWLNAAGVRGPLFIPAILLSAWYGGIGPGLLAAGLSILATDYFFLRPMPSLGPIAVEDAAYLLVFGLTALLVAWLTATQRRTATEMERQASLLDLTHDTVFVRDPDDVITYWNRGAAQLYGWSSEEAIGKSPTIFCKPSSRCRSPISRRRCTGLTAGRASWCIRGAMGRA